MHALRQMNCTGNRIATETYYNLMFTFSQEGRDFGDEYLAELDHIGE